MRLLFKQKLTCKRSFGFPFPFELLSANIFLLEVDISIVEAESTDAAVTVEPLTRISKCQ
jgi:hypothetical protein